MRSRTEILLYQLAWVLDKMMRPTWRNLDSSFEMWAYGNGMLRQIQRLEAQAYIESRRDEQGGQRAIRLTQKGLAAGQIGHDPEPRWQRSWDGKWRIILFDLPEDQREIRRRLRRKLRSSGFGCMQRSAWISPDPLNDLAANLRPLAVNVAKLVVLDAAPCSGESSADMVRAAWDFKRIDEVWRHLEIHLSTPPDTRGGEARDNVLRWVARERKLLQSCFQFDPLLPRQLHPTSYRGTIVWNKRRQILGKLATIRF